MANLCSGRTGEPHRAGSHQFELGQSCMLLPADKPRGNLKHRLILLAGFLVLSLIMALGLLSSWSQSSREKIESVNKRQERNEVPPPI